MKSIKRFAAVAVSALALWGAASSAHASLWTILTGSSAQNGNQTQVAANTKRKPATGAGGTYKDGNYAGRAVNAYYGLVQVQANVSGSQLVSVDVLQYPKDRRTSRYINSQAIPVLQSEAISAQTAQVDVVSGATLTSEAFARSLDNALGQARN